MEKRISSGTITLLVFVALALMIGLASVSAVTDTGTASVSVTEVVEVNFTTDSLDWGAGSVNSGSVSATLNSNGSGSVTGGSWSTDSGELVLENIGSEDVNIDLLSSADADTLVGGTASINSFQWLVQEVESSSCTGTTNVTGMSYTDVNTTSPGTRICTTFDATDASDSIKVDFKIVIPSDTSVSGAQSATITATATEIVD